MKYGDEDGTVAVTKLNLTSDEFRALLRHPSAYGRKWTDEDCEKALAKLNAQLDRRLRLHR